MERFLDLLNSVKKNNNSTFYSCEPELIELMRQIDEMIEEKKRDWEKEIKILEDNLQNVKEENVFFYSEVENLKKNLSSTNQKLTEEKKFHSNTLSQYDRDVKMLKEDLNNLKKKYTGLQKKILNSKRKKEEKDMLEKAKIDNVFPNKYPVYRDNIQNTNAIIGADTVTDQLNSETKNNSTSISEFSILKLQLESVQLENRNLRSMLKENNQLILQTIIPQHINNHETRLSTENLRKFDQVTMETIKLPVSDLRSNTDSIGTCSISSFENFNGFSSVQFNDLDDQSLENKLGSVIAQFETST